MSSRAMKSNELGRLQIGSRSPSRRLDTLRRQMRILLSLGSLLAKSSGTEGFRSQRSSVRVRGRHATYPRRESAGRRTGIDSQRKIGVGRKCVSVRVTENLVGMAFLRSLPFTRL